MTSDPIAGAAGGMRRLYIDTPSGQVHARAAGSGDQLVLLLHQTAASSVMFERFVARLADEPGLFDAYRFVAIDTPGFGQSYIPEAAYSLLDWAATLLDVATTLDAPTFHLLGHHTGAAIAAAVAATSPRVLSLGMIGALALSAKESARWHATVHGMHIDDEGSHLGSAWTQVATIDGDPTAYPPDLALRHREAVDKLSAGERWHEAYLAVFSSDVGALLAETSCPIILFSGEADVLHQYVPQTLAARTGIHYHPLAAGAYVLDQQPELVAAPYAEFLRAVSRGTS